MILLISPYQNASECAAQIQRRTQDKVKHATTIGLALAALRVQSFDLVVADENLLESTPDGAESLMQRMESAAPIVLDLACLRPEKVAKLVVETQRRHELQFKLACERARAEIRSEMKSELTGLLISSELVMKTANLPFPASEKLAAVVEIARRMKSRLESKEK